MSESTGKGHQVPDSTSLSIRLATEYNEPTVLGTTEIVPSTKELTETTTAPGGLVQHTMASQKQSVCGSLSSPAVSGDVPLPLERVQYTVLDSNSSRLLRSILAVRMRSTLV